ncbi:methyltransferase domain-containing protein [Erwinia sp. CPCC 100877]|nr:methyltransferase domain-containing protein [Erwinia sp. CPCC 100877]
MGTKKIGHLFLAELGKKRLRPGGVKATGWLLEQAQFTKEAKVLEVACNMGTTLIEIAKKYPCSLIGVDIDKEALAKAQTAIEKEQLQERVVVQPGNALKLPFEDNTFDIVINEAMLTMLDDDAKAKALAEYYRVLKPGGRLLTHDISLPEGQEAEKEALSKTIKTRVSPLSVANWQRHYQSIGFAKVDYQVGPMSLMSPSGMLRDEGITGTLTIVKNGLKAGNREQFLDMFRYFRKQQKVMRYIVHCAIK